jgi:hypothetical protein
VFGLSARANAPVLLQSGQGDSGIWYATVAALSAATFVSPRAMRRLQ